MKERWWMPPKKKTIANMEAKIADLEQELSLMKVAFSDSIAEVQQTARENQRALMQMMEKVLGGQEGYSILRVERCLGNQG